MKIKNVQIVAFLLIVTTLMGQKTEDKLYKIYLQNKTKFYGTIKSMNEQGDIFLKIYQDTMNIYIPANTIKKIEPIPSKDEKEVQNMLVSTTKKQEYKFREKGYYATFSVGLAPGNYSESRWQNSWNPGFCVYQTFGYQFNRMYNLALGVGSEVFYLDHRMFPVFIETKGYWFAKRFTPYHSLGVGYSFASRNKNYDIISAKGNIFVCPSIGYRFGGRDSFNFYSELGLRIQQATYTKLMPWLSDNTKFYEENWLYKRISFKIGIQF